MSDLSLQKNNQEFISSRDAARLFGVTHDYISRLCRQGKLEGKFEGRMWFVKIASLEGFFGSYRLPLAETSAPDTQPIFIVPKKLLPALPKKDFRKISLLPLLAGALAIMFLMASAFVMGGSAISSRTNTAAVVQVDSPFFAGNPFMLFSKIASFFLKPIVNETPAKPTPEASIGTEQMPPVPAHTTIVQNIYPITERLIEHTSFASGVSEDTLDQKLSELDNRIRTLLLSTMSAPNSLPATGGITNNIALTQRIDQLFGTTLTDVVVHGISGLTASDIPGDVVASNYLPLAGGALTGSLVGTDITLSGTTTVSSLASCDTIDTDATGKFLCGSDQTSTGMANPFAWPTQYGVVTAATTSPLWAQNGLFASSTSHFANADFINSTSTNATTTNFAITGISGQLLKTLSSGAVVAAVAGIDYVANSSTAFSSTSAIYFTNASTTIPKTYTANTFTGAQTLSGGLTLTGLSGLLQGNGSSAVTAVTGLPGQFPYYSTTNTVSATSTISLAASGKIGINITSPTAYFHVVGRAAAAGSGSAADNVITATGGQGGSISGTNTTGGAGGAYSFTGGTGGSGDSSSSGSVGGAGGAFAITGGTGGSAGGTGGAVTNTSGTGGSGIVAEFSRSGGTGGALTISAARGGSGGACTSSCSTGTNGGAGGTLSLLTVDGASGGSGSSVTNASGGNGGRAGNIVLTGGTGGTGGNKNGSGTGGDGGIGASLLLTAGDGGAANTGGAAGAAGAITLTGGTGGAGSGTAGTSGGSITIQPGAGGTGSTAGNYGNLILNALGGNVGIGTTSPSVLLDLGASTNNSKLLLYDDGAFKYGLGVQSAQFRFHLDSSTSRFSFMDSPAGSELVTILGTGNLGVGDITPSSLFTVGNGDLFTVDSTGRVVVGADSSASSGSVFQLLLNGNQTAASSGTYYGISSGPSFTTTGTLASFVGMQGSPKNASSGTVTSMFGIQAVPQKTSTGPVSSMYGVFSRLDNTNATGVVTTGYQLYLANNITTGAISTLYGVFQQDANASNYFAGSVGIGDTTPTEADLVVGNAGAGSIFVTGSAAPASSRYVCFDSAGASLLYAGGAAPGTDCDSSSRAIKHDINTLNVNALDIITSLSPVSYIYNEDASSTVHYGFIAEDSSAADQHLAGYDAQGQAKNLDKSAFLAVLWKATQEINLNFLTIASSTSSSTPASAAFATSFFHNLFARISFWLADSGNGILDLFAATIHAENVYTDTVHAKTLCAGTTCVDEAGLAHLLQYVSSHEGVGTGGETSGSSAPAPDVGDEEASTTPPSEEAAPEPKAPPAEVE